MHHISMEVAEMLSALRSTLEDPCGAATTSGAAQEPSAPVMPQLLLAGAPPVPAYVGCVGAQDNRVSTSPCPESRAGGCEAEDLTAEG